MAFISRYRVKTKDPVITFEDVRTPSSAVGERFLCVNGTRLYYLGITCDTCAYLFEKRGYEYRLSPAEIAARLQEGVDLLDRDLLAAIGVLLPTDDYGVVETEFVPRATGPCEPDDYFAHESVAFFGLDPTWGVPDNPKIRYWRAGESVLPDAVRKPREWRTFEGERIPQPQLFYHLVVPMEPPHVLDRVRIDHFRSSMEAGARPAAIGVSVLDVRSKPYGPGADADYGLLDATAWCLTTMLLDGHHKMQAAAESGRPVRLLTYIASRPSIADAGDLEVVLKELASWRSAAVAGGEPRTD